MKIKFFVNDTKPTARQAKAPLIKEARRLGLTVTNSTADVVITLGGDGTILRAVHNYPETPILGLNLGGLGYLSDVAPDFFTDALSKLANGKFSIQDRTMLSASQRQGKTNVFALNEIMVRHEMSGHAVALEFAADGKNVTRYLADGLVVATPTGSTAYSLSAGGPIIMPDAEVFVVTPLCPHALTARSIVSRDNVSFSITARRRGDGRSDPVGVYADGEKAFSLKANETVQICKSKINARIISLDGSNPYDTLARKLGWSGS